GVEIDRVGPHQGGVEHEAHAPGAVVDQGEGGHRAGPHAEDLEQQRLRAERQPGRADGPVQGLEVDAGLAQGADQPDLALGVLEEQVLGVAAGQGGLDLQ
ncbi:hypothetical protein AAULR_25821, partial [Lacticaseibacillus rhamnosus MTCC 5462]